jgi:hypothetical protein
MEALRSADAEDELGAILALGLYGPDARDAVPLLVQELDKHKDVDMHSHNVVLTLGKIGPAARAAIPELSKRLDANRSLAREGQFAIWIPRLEAATALVKIDPGNRQALDTFREALGNNDIDHRTVYEAAIRCLDDIGPEAAKPLVPELLKVMQHEKNTIDEIDHATASALKKIDPRLAEAEFKRLGYKGLPDMGVLAPGAPSKKAP